MRGRSSITWKLSAMRSAPNLNLILLRNSIAKRLGATEECLAGIFDRGVSTDGLLDHLSATTWYGPSYKGESVPRAIGYIQPFARGHPVERRRAALIEQVAAV